MFQTRHEAEKQNGPSEERDESGHASQSMSCKLRSDFFLFYWYLSNRAFFISVSLNNFILFFFFSFLNPHTKPLLPTFPP